MPHQTIGRFGLRVAAHSIETTNFDQYVCQFTQPDALEIQPACAAPAGQMRRPARVPPALNNFGICLTTLFPSAIRPLIGEYMRKKSCAMPLASTNGAWGETPLTNGFSKTVNCHAGIVEQDSQSLTSMYLAWTALQKVFWLVLSANKPVVRLPDPRAAIDIAIGVEYLDLANEAVTFGGSEASFHLKEAFAGFVPKAIG